MIAPVRSRKIALFLLAVLFAPPGLWGQSTLNFPRLSFEEGTLTGVAIVNPSGVDATVTITAYGEDGLPLAGIENPVEVVVPANQQFSRLTSELFGAAAPGTAGWFQATSDISDLTGFFLFLNTQFTEFDGADLPATGKTLVFNQVQIGNGFSTEFNLINPADVPANVQLNLVDPFAGVSTRVVNLAGKGAARLDPEEFFAIESISPGTYVSIDSDIAIGGFQFVRSPDGDLSGLNARRLVERLSHLYFPQLAVLGPFETELGVVNYSSAATILTATAFKPDGSIYDTANLQSNPVTRSLAPGGSLVEDVAEMFGFFGDDTLDGWLLVEASSESINGFLSYGIPSVGSLATVAPTALGRTRALFSHIATVSGFFTGVAVLNSGQLAADVRILAIQPSGEVLGSFNTVLQPSERLSQLINELIPAAADQSGGLIWVKSEQPVHSTSLFGSTAVLSNIPPQSAPLAYAPDAGVAGIVVDPPLAVVQPTGGQQFSAIGATEQVTWRVNGVAGGNETVGTISSTGLYTAPTAAPTPRVLTVSASTSNQVAGASVDVIEKQALLTSSAIVQSVTYLGSLERIYTAELALLSGFESSEAGVPGQDTTDSEIFEVSAEGVKTSVVQLEGERVAKMVGFRASNGQEFLLLALESSGRIVRVTPGTGETFDVATDLNQPTALVVDPVTGNLLVAEADKITEIPRIQLEVGLSASATLDDRKPVANQVELVPTQGGAGVAVDQCTGNVFFSERDTGRILELVRATGQTRPLFTIRVPTQLLGFYRSGVSCPDAFQLLVIDEDSNQIFLYLPSRDLVVVWLGAVQSTDISFLGQGSPFLDTEAIILSELLEEGAQQFGGSSVSLIDIPYTEDPENEPPEEDKEVPIDLDPALAAIVRALLGLAPSDPILPSDALALETLNADDAGIETIDGLEFFLNLTTLSLSGNSIGDLEALAELTSLRSLEAANNDLTSVSDLAGLFRLQSLNLSGNQISDTSDLIELTSLQTLDLSSNRVNDLSGLAGMTELENAFLQDNRISDVSPLVNLDKLREVDLSGNVIRSMAAFDTMSSAQSGGENGERFPDLQTLILSGNSLANTSGLGVFTQLTRLLADNNNLTSISDLASLLQLVELNLANNQIADISALQNLSNLRNVDLSGNLIASLAPLVLNSGIGTGDQINIRNNSLDRDDCTDIASLQSAGATVDHLQDCSGLGSTPAGPDLGIQSTSAFVGSIFTVDVVLGGFDDASALVFSVDYDENKLDFDVETDANSDGIPDSVQVNRRIDFPFVLIDVSDTDGEIDLALLVAPPDAIPEDVVVTLKFRVKPSAPTGTTLLRFSEDPAPSLGDSQAVSRAFDELIVGRVRIQ